MLDTFGAHQGLQNYEAQSRLASSASAQKTREGDDKAEEAGYRRKLIRDLATAKSDKGQYMTDFARQAREGEREYQLSNKTIDLNSTKAATDALTDQAKLAQDAEESKFNKWLKQQQLGLDSGRLNETIRHNQAMEQKSKTGSPKDRVKLRKEAIKYRSDISRAAGDIKTILAKAKENGIKIDSSGLRTVLNKQYKDSNVVNSAMDLYYRGGLSPANREVLKQQGYGVPQKWVSKYKKPKSLKKVKAGGEMNLG